jgi:hypothetical protein
MLLNLDLEEEIDLFKFARNNLVTITAKINCSTYLSLLPCYTLFAAGPE